ncbi:hypothetical protein [Veronia pacifica]|uniref:Uncharacterized protein n=1 Tax=Veronia pacifica TaxID=1080227 RepID=A0A1C3EES8_9GAMM|nr:hypothetical protein [Veronia pacifica]ODA31745.1 hypothetical protein A8L45_15305 [Veronia pacifica]
MAAEKLTRARLLQILFMMSLLITAFFWRTFNHDTSISAKTCVLHNNQCDIKAVSGPVSIRVGANSSDDFSLTVTSMEKPTKVLFYINKNKKIEAESVDGNTDDKYVYTVPTSNLDVNEKPERAIVFLNEDQVKVAF